jgi:hypothetical protein
MRKMLKTRLKYVENRNSLSCSTFSRAALTFSHQKAPVEPEMKEINHAAGACPCLDPSQLTHVNFIMHLFSGRQSYGNF